MATEKRLIELDTLINKLDYDYDLEKWTLRDEPEDIPTVDAVEVVRCKDCENWMYEYDDVGLCVTDVPDIDGVQRHACDFCSYGERKRQ